MLKFLRWAFLSIIMMVAILIAGREILFVGPVQTVTPLPTDKILDMHVHVAGIGAGNSGCFVSEQMRDSYKFDYYLKAFGVSRQEIIEQGDQLVFKRLAEKLNASRYVGQAIILALDGVIDEQGRLDKQKTQVYIPNEFVAAQTAQYENLLFGASINPYRKDALQRLETAYQQGARLIKWIPSIQHIDPSDNRLISFYHKMRDLALPLLSHTGQERSFHTAIDEYADPKRLQLPLSLGVTVIAAHVATTGENQQQNNFERILPMFKRFPNLFADISSLTQINKLGYLAKALTAAELKGRLLYGSDFPLINMILVSPYYFPLNLSIGEMRRIAEIENPWDRDVVLKQALGVPTELFVQNQRFFYSAN